MAIARFHRRWPRNRTMYFVTSSAAVDRRSTATSKKHCHMNAEKNVLCPSLKPHRPALRLGLDMLLSCNAITSTRNLLSADVTHSLVTKTDQKDARLEGEGEQNANNGLQRCCTNCGVSCEDNQCNSQQRRCCKSCKRYLPDVNYDNEHQLTCRVSCCVSVSVCLFVLVTSLTASARDSDNVTKTNRFIILTTICLQNSKTLAFF